MGLRAVWLRLAVGAAMLGITLSVAGCGAAALPPPPPPTPTLAPVTATPTPAATATRATSAPTASPASGGNSALLAAGKADFKGASCAACHALSAAGTTSTVGPSLNGIGSKHDAAWILAQIANPCAPGHANAAPGFSCGVMPARSVSGSQAQAIAAFLAAQK